MKMIIITANGGGSEGTSDTGFGSNPNPGGEGGGGFSKDIIALDSISI